MLRLIILRILRERRLMGVMLLSMCLVTGFLALGPLYTQALSVSDFDRRIDIAAPSDFSVTIRNELPFVPELPQIIDDNLSQYIGEQRSYSSTSGFNCGFMFDETAENNIGSNSFRIECYRPYTYDDITRYFSVAEGRLPQNTGTDLVEGVVTLDTALDREFELGDQIIIGPDPDSAVFVEIVGFVEPILPETATFWNPQTILSRVVTFYTNIDSRLDISFIVTPQALREQLLEVSSVPIYTHQFDLQPETLDFFELNSISSGLQTAEDSIRRIHPDMTFSTPFTRLLTAFINDVSAAQGPITLISFLVLVLMLYNIVATSSLILEQQSQEWSMMASRGGSNFQLIYIQSVTVSLLGIIAGVLGPLVAYTIMLILATVGPYAAIVDAAQIGSIPLQSWQMSAIAAVIMVIVLTFPAWSYASKSLKQLKSTMARAPESPFWARYFLDIIILVAGFIFLLRLFFLSTDGNILDILLDPSALIDLLAGDSATLLFADAFNLAGPVLLLLGASMLWLRIFPFMMRLLGVVFAGGDGLTTRLAFWNVERDPAHYAQLVLLLIGTLSLGTASLALSETRLIGGWEAAKNQVGADVEITFAPQDYDPSIDWDSYPSVVDAVPLMRVSSQLNNEGALIALDPAEISTEELAHIAAPFELLGNQSLDLSGMPIPENTIRLTLDIYAEPQNDDAIVESRVALVVEDQIGVKFDVPLDSSQVSESGAFYTHLGIVPQQGVQPYRIVRLELLSEHETSVDFQHTIYIDNLVGIDATDNRTLLNGFEADTNDQWQWASTSRRGQIVESTAFSNNTERFTQGTSSLGLTHNMRNTVNPLLINYNARLLPPIPVVVTQSFANAEGQASRLRRPLQVGDSLTVGLNIPTTPTAASREEFTYAVIGIVENPYPTFTDGERLIFVNYDILRYWLNAAPFTTQFPGLIYDINTVWLELDGREPAPEFVQQIQQLENVESVSFAWDRFQEIQRDPLTNAVTGMLFAGFWVSLLLSLMDFAFYMALTIRRRALSFATLQALGWSERNILNLLLVEQIAFVTPALIIGVVFGMLLATLILPFLSLIGALQLQFPIVAISLLIAVIAIAFALILRIAAIVLRRLSLNTVLRFGE